MSTDADTGLLLLRLAIGVVMAFHGTDKLFAWWGGGPDRAERFFASQGFHPPRQLALAAGATEITGAVLIATGGLTVLGTAMLTGVLTNVVALHLRNGLDHRKHGFEFELMILAAVVAVGLCGPGGWSIDNAAGVPARAWLAPVAIAVGLVGGLAVSATRRAPAKPPAVPVAGTSST